MVFGKRSTSHPQCHAMSCACYPPIDRSQFIKLFFPTRTVVKDVHVLSDQEIEDTIRQQIEVAT